VVDGFALVAEARLVVTLHDATAGPVAHSGAKIGLGMLAPELTNQVIPMAARLQWRKKKG